MISKDHHKSVTELLATYLVVTLRSWWVNWWGLSRHYNTCLGQGKTVRFLFTERSLFKEIDLAGVGCRRNYRE